MAGWVSYSRARIEMVSNSRSNPRLLELLDVLVEEVQKSFITSRGCGFVRY